MSSIFKTFRGQLGDSFPTSPERISISAPKLAWLLYLTVPLFAIDIILIHYESAVLIAILGGFIEVVGAISISMPERTVVEDYTRVGKLRHVLKQMGPGWGPRNMQSIDSPGSEPLIRSQTKGTNEAIDVLRPEKTSGSRRDEDSLMLTGLTLNWDNADMISFKDDLPNTVEPKPNAGHIRLSHSPNVTVFGIRNTEIITLIPWVSFEHQIQTEIGRQERLFTTFGIAMIILGFIQLLISYILSIGTG